MVKAVKAKSAVQLEVEMAADFFNKALTQGYVSAIIRKMPKDMLHINVDPEVIADELDKHIKEGFMPFVSVVEMWRPWNRWSKAYATTYTGDFSRIRVNSRKKASFESRVGTVGHEWGHCFEYWFKMFVNSEIYFNHGDNKRKNNTFQYQLGIQLKVLAGEASRGRIII